MNYYLYLYVIIYLGDTMASFYETIFLKEDSSFENKLNTIDKQLYDKSDFYKLEKGMRGEQQIFYHLKKSNSLLLDLYDFQTIIIRNNTANMWAFP